MKEETKETVYRLRWFVRSKNGFGWGTLMTDSESAV